MGFFLIEFHAFSKSLPQFVFVFLFDPCNGVKGFLVTFFDGLAKFRRAYATHTVAVVVSFPRRYEFDEFEVPFLRVLLETLEGFETVRPTDDDDTLVAILALFCNNLIDCAKGRGNNI